jgi:hypothetical protein
VWVPRRWWAASERVNGDGDVDVFGKEKPNSSMTAFLELHPGFGQF